MTPDTYVARMSWFAGAALGMPGAKEVSYYLYFHVFQEVL